LPVVELREKSRILPPRDLLVNSRNFGTMIQEEPDRSLLV